MSGDLLPDRSPEALQPPRTRLSSLVGPFLGLLLIIFLGGVVEVLKEHTLRYWALPNQCLILTQTVTVAMGAIGMTMIIISAGIDLSVGSVIALTAVVAAWVTHRYGGVGAGQLAGMSALYLPLLALAAAVAVGGAAGAINGGLITRLRLAPFIITLGMMSFARGTAKQIALEQKIDAPMSWIQDFAAGNLKLFTMGFQRVYTLPLLGPVEVDWKGDAALSTAVLVTLLLAAGASLVLARTRFGRHVFAIGSNEATARLCGIRVPLVKVGIYVLAGVLTGLAGLMQFARLTQGDPTVAIGLELDVIAAVVFGGGTLSGGEGSILGALVGAMLMTEI